MRGVGVRRALGRIKWRIARAASVRRAVGQARSFASAQPTAVRICWDLDNTLVASGKLLARGLTLDRAVVDAYPVDNMLDYYDAVRNALPEASHFILSARPANMRGATQTWLEQNGLTPERSAVCLVPEPDIKPRIWAELARGTQLVIVDDLRFNHEAEIPDLYHDLIDLADDVAVAYIGGETIDRLETGEVTPTAAAQTLAAKVTRA